MFAPPYSEVYLHQAGLRTVRFRPAADCPPGLLDQARQLFDATAGWVLPWSRLGELDHFLQACLHEADAPAHELRVDDLALAHLAQQRDAQHRRQLLAKAYPKGAADKGLAKLLKSAPRRQQRPAAAPRGG